MVLGCLHNAARRENQLYLVKQTTLPLHLTLETTWIDAIFADLRKLVPKTPHTERRQEVCISNMTWCTIGDRVALWRSPT